MVPEMSAASKQRIKAAVETTCDLIEAGEPLEKAAAEAALEHGVPPSHLSPLCYAVNIASMENRRQMNDDTLEKAASVEVARPENVAELMVQRTRTHKARKKVAAAEVVDPWAPPSTLRDEYKPPFHASYVEERVARPEPEDLLRKSARAAEELGVHAQGVQLRLRDTATELLESLDDWNGPTFANLRRDGVPMYGEDADAVLNWVEAMAPPKYLKSAGHQRHTLQARSFTLLKSAVEQYREVRWLAAYEKKAAEAVKTAAFLDQKLGKEHELMTVLFGVTKSAVSMGDMAKLVGYNELMSKGEVKDPLKEPASIESYKDQTDSMEHEAQLRNINLAATLGGLMTTDDVIRNSPPSEVLNHYNELAKTSPVATQDQGTLRALLRKRLMAGKNAIDPFEIAQMRDLEKGYQTVAPKTQVTQGV